MSANKPAMRAGPHPQGHTLPNPKLQLQEDRFRFTPVKVQKPAPRIWDRQPSTPFLARPKSRKLWKRFRTSFNSMKALQQLIAPQSDQDEDLYTEINASRNKDYLRGVKRRCLVHDSEDQLQAITSRGRSFLETKWESEATGRRRKFPADSGRVDDSEPIAEPLGANDEINCENACDTPTSMDGTLLDSAERDESVTDVLGSPTRLAASAAYPCTLHGLQSGMDGCTADIKGSDDIDPSLADLPGPYAREAGDPTGAEMRDDDAALDVTMTDDLRSGSSEQQPSLTVSSENVAQTDTTAPLATAPVQELTAEQESTLVRSALRSSLDGEDAALLNSFLSKAKAKREAKAAAAAAAMVTPEGEEQADQGELEIPEIPTPQGRRVLEDLDANSPSPQKAHLSPSKVLSKDIDENEDQSPASPRRSTRTRNVKPPPRMTTTTTAARNTLTLRRAKGDEFVFLKRTEAQELALATRRNTRQNKGDAMMPKYTLQALAQLTPDSKASSDDDESACDTSHRRAKRVSWNDERLVEFEGESGEGSTDDAAGWGGKSKASEKRKAASSRTTRSQDPSKTGVDTEPAASTTAAATATPRARRVRRLGTPKPTAAVDVSASPSMSPPATRKKLTPKSPRMASTESTASKKVSSISTRSGTQASLNSSSLKSSSLFKTHAGSTPMPRRVRSRP
ncbi:hypothetical protein BBP40_003976 [Aspergillus hancockii]|nr:hypothetical protein BBP40_003976 [Aspergillus hancockii]